MCNHSRGVADLREQIDMTEGISLPPAGEPDRACIKCDEIKPAEEFHRSTTGRGAPRRMGQCRACRAAARKGKRGGEKKASRKPSTREIKRRELLHAYGITLEQYQEMLAAQKNVCAICATPAPGGRNLLVDHCHQSGRVRALLCIPCNTAIGRYERLQNNAEPYLARYGKGNPLLRYDPPGQ